MADLVADGHEQTDVVLRPRRRVDVVAREALRAAVADDVHRLVGCEPPVHGDLRDAQLLQRALDHEPFERQPEPHAQAIAFLEAERGQRIGDSIGPVVPLGVGHHRVALDRRRARRALAGPELRGAWLGFGQHGAR